MMDREELKAERERIGRLEEEIRNHKQRAEYIEYQIGICKEQLAALPPEEGDLSVWRPEEGEDCWFIDIHGSVHKGNAIALSFPDSYNIYRTKAEAESAAKYLRLCARLHQMHVRLYGAEGWVNCVGLDTWCISLYGEPSAFRSTSFAGIPEARFKTKADAERVIAQLQKEGIV